MKKSKNEMNLFELYGYLDKNKISPMEFSNYIGVTHGAVAHWLNGRRDIPEIVLRIIRFFGPNIKDLMKVKSDL